MVPMFWMISCARHAHAVVADAQDALFLVHRNLDAEGLVLAERFDSGEGFVPRLVDGVGGVGNQLAEENLLVAVQGVDHEVEQLLYLGLEFHFFLGRFGHGISLRINANGPFGPGA